MEENKVKKQKGGAPAPGAPPPRSATVHTMKVRLVKFYNSCSQETVTCYDVPNMWMHCREKAEEKAVSIKLGILWLRKKRHQVVHTYYSIKVPFSPDSQCGWKGCFVFSVQFLITKKNGGVDLLTGVMSMSSQVPN